MSTQEGTRGDERLNAPHPVGAMNNGDLLYRLGDFFPDLSDGKGLVPGWEVFTDRWGWEPIDFTLRDRFGDDSYVVARVRPVMVEVNADDIRLLCEKSTPLVGLSESERVAVREAGLRMRSILDAIKAAS